ncbi:MAG: delta-aminolevulinic acid dehydratase [Pseudomonadota bacterium]
MCLWEGSFADVAPKADLVVQAQVESHKGNSIDISVKQTLLGKAYLDSLRVWMQAKDYCRPPVDEFPDGSSWLFALRKIREVPVGGFDSGTPSISYGRVDDYVLSSCGGYWLSFTGSGDADENGSKESGVVTGNLINAPRWAREPDMTPVFLEVVSSYLAGSISRTALIEATQRNPEVRDLMLDTKAFLRGDPEIEP